MADAIPSDSVTCGQCSRPLAQGAAICSHCGWDLITNLGVSNRRGSRLLFLAACGWRIVVYGLLLAVPLVGYSRLKITGPGPDLATTLHWISHGDGGRQAELVTIHRAFTVGGAAVRYALRNMEAPTFTEGHNWEAELAPLATMNTRGYLPELLISTDSAPASVRELFEVSRVDGWGNPYRVRTRAMARSQAWEQDPEVAADLELGLQMTPLRVGKPDFAARDWLRLELISGGGDGIEETADDIRMVSYIPVGLVVRLNMNPRILQRQLEREDYYGRHYFRFEGNRWDLIDAQLLAEFRLECAAAEGHTSNP